jgi:hypothetical protein
MARIGSFTEAVVFDVVSQIWIEVVFSSSIIVEKGEACCMMYGNRYS